jgi:hypothetical protein
MRYNGYFCIESEHSNFTPFLIPRSDAMNEPDEHARPYKNEGYLSRKRSGGASNEKGGRYEQFFAVFKIAELAASNWKTMDSVSLSSQINAFVDDLLVVNEERYSYFQLKSGKRVHWGENVKGTLLYDFQGQALDSKARLEVFELSLVVAEDSEFHSLIEGIPREIVDCTSVVLFPAYSTTIELLTNVSFRSHVSNIAISEDVALDQLDGLTKCILGIWVGGARKEVSLGKLIDELREIKGLFVRRSVPVKLSSSLMEVLDQISDFEYWEEGGFLRWRFRKFDNGTVLFPIGSVEFSTMEDSIWKSKPIDFLSLEPLFS